MKFWRIHLVFCLILLGGAILVGRLVFLQIMQYGFYKALAQGQQGISSISKGERGQIFAQDKQGNLYTLATSRQVPFVFVSPREIEDKEITAKKLSEVLHEDEHLLEEKLQNEESFYEIIKKRISSEEEESLRKENLVGVYVKSDRRRYYPQGQMASRILGFTNEEGNGQYGLEAYYQEILEGKEGLTQKARSVASYLISAFQNRLEHGSDLILSIDYNIQSQAEFLLEKAKESLAFQEGTMVVLDPGSGKILAIANVPNFNPNEYFQVEDIAIFQNPSVQQIFEPGSVFKPITMAAALQEGAILPDTTYEDAGIVKIGGFPIYNYDQRVWGKRTMTEVLQFSINTGAVFAEQQLGHQKFLTFVEKFGIFEPTGIDLSEEIYSQNKELKRGYEINFATASFGQGIEMTPLQLIRAYSAIANGGVLVKPYIVEKIIKEGSIQETKPTFSLPIISQQTATQVTSMLVNVVENGFAKKARIPGYSIAGKTGTAQIPWSVLGIRKSGYSDNTTQSFIGYGPAFNPQFLILVKLNNPQTKTAEYSALPLFRDLAKYIIDYYQIPPDYEP